MQVRVLDYRGEQDVWATIAEPDGKLAQVKLKDGQFTIVAELWDGAEQVEIAQHLTNDGEESGYLECAEEGEEPPCGWHVAADALSTKCKEVTSLLGIRTVSRLLLLQSANHLTMTKTQIVSSGRY